MTKPYEIYDVVVVLPGILGSMLVQNGKLIWAPSGGVVVLDAIKIFGHSIQRLKLPENIGDRHPNDGVELVALIPDLHILPVF